MASFNCAKYCTKHENNNGRCSGLISSNGHSTWCTPLYNDESWEDVTNNDFESIFPPYINENNKPACNGFEKNIVFDFDQLQHEKTMIEKEIQDMQYTEDVLLNEQCYEDARQARNLRLDAEDKLYKIRLQMREFA